MITDTILPLEVAPPTPNLPGQSILLLGVVPNLDSGLYGVPFVVQSTLSAYNVFGPGRFIRAIGETFRQGITQVYALAVAQETDIPSVFDSLVDIEFDILVPVGLTATPDRYATFGNIAYIREQTGSPIMIVMPTDLSAAPTVSTLTTSPAATAAGSVTLDGVPYPNLFSRYFMSVLDQVIVNPNTPSQYQVDAAPSIAGKLATMKPQSTLTNQALIGVKLVNGYNSADALTLAQSGYITLRNSQRRGLCVNYAVTATSSDTASPIYSPSYHNATTLRICQFVLSSITNACQGYIGDASSLLIKSTIDTTVTALKNNGSVLDAQYSVTINQVMGTAAIAISVLVPTETTRITLNAQLSYIRS